MNAAQARAGLSEHLVFAVLDALSWDDIEIRYVSSSRSRYPVPPG
jgi:hypothetical protein